MRPISTRFTRHLSRFTFHFSRGDLFGATTAGVIVVVFCLILLWRNPLVFWNDDYELSVLPVFADMARSWSEGHWPILSPFSWVCGNLAGEFQYGVFSVFVNAVIIAIWKFPLTFPQQAATVSVAHLFVLAMGAFLLARDRRFSIPVSIFVALVASLNGWIICWGATDWFGALGAFTWLPWAWWGAARALDPGRSKWRFIWPAPFVYLLVTGGFPYTVLMLVVLIGWLAIKSLAETRNSLSVASMLFGVALGFGLSAPAWLAILDLVQGSARELQPAKAHWQWLVPPAALPGLILPCWTVNWADFSNRYLPHATMELTSGLVAPAALIGTLASHRRVLLRQIRWELVLLLLVFLLSMIPTVGFFRWSFRWLPFFHLVLAICAAEALRARPGSLIPAMAALSLTAVIAIIMITLGTTGSYSRRFGVSGTSCCAVLNFRDGHLSRSRFRHSWRRTSAYQRIAVFPGTISLSNCLNLHHSIQCGCISVFIPGRNLPIAYQTNRSRSAQFCDQGVHRCGRDCISSTVIVRFGRLAWRGNSPLRFTVRLTPLSEVICSVTKLVKMAN
ncbi:MAG: hypothetical protein DME65_08130 [Verrucomicrobia bacterium]|nr:MAG: hypothetical protein DME65_08130 [Verrucomicrobiota bacterium]